MFLASLSVEGYRSLRSAEIPFSSLTSLIGPNGSGKSTILGAIRLFFDPTRHVSEADFWRGTHDEQQADTVSIVTHWTSLSEEAQSAFADFIDEDGDLVVERRFEVAGKGEYLASRLAMAEFSDLRAQVRDHRAKYDDLRREERFASLPQVRNRDEVFAALEEWERNHPALCTRLTESFGRMEVLTRHVSFLYIGAFEDPSVHLGSTSTGAIGRLVASVVDNSEVTTQLQTIADEATERSAAVLHAQAGTLDSVGRAMAQRIESFSPGCSIRLAWDRDVAVRGAQAKLLVQIEAADGQARGLEYQGHGVQRSLMYAALTTAADVTGSEGRPILLVVEEPEAFQHPLSSKVLARSLRQLSAGSHQIAYSTHSPDFVHSDTVDGLRVVRRQEAGGRVATTVKALSDEGLLERWSTVFEGGDYFTVESVQARLAAHMTPSVLGGLFANLCVLVEGDEDEALIRGIADRSAHDFDAEGIAVIQTNGKTGMPNVLTFLAAAGVRCFPVFDLDRDKPRVEDQHRAAEAQILRALGAADRALEGGVEDALACWRNNMTTTVAAELGEGYDRLLIQSAAKFGYPVGRARKVATVVSDVLSAADSEGLSSPSLVAVCQRVVDLASG